MITDTWADLELTRRISGGGARIGRSVARASHGALLVGGLGCALVVLHGEVLVARTRSCVSM